MRVRLDDRVSPFHDAMIFDMDRATNICNTFQFGLQVNPCTSLAVKLAWL